MNSEQAKTLVRGIAHDGIDPLKLSDRGRAEIREAISVIVDLIPTDDTVAVSGIHLLRHGDHVMVLAEIDGQWVEVIRARHDGMFSHIVEPGGMRKAADALG